MRQRGSINRLHDSAFLLSSRWLVCHIWFVGAALLCLPLFAACQAPTQYKSPPGYDLNKPQKFVVSKSLHEISGIALVNRIPDSLYAIEDEDGKLFKFHLGDGVFNHTKFGKKGDYEDVTILKSEEVIVLRSDGSLFCFPLDKAHDKKVDSVKEYINILPQGEYEGLYIDDDGKLYAMCKNCPVDSHHEVTVYILQKNAMARWAITSQFQVSPDKKKLTSINEKIRFHPSCLSKNPITHEWYIVSSVNKLLITLDPKWNITAYYSLDPVLFKQPEGLAFDREGNMYISNEGVQGDGDVLLFNRIK